MDPISARKGEPSSAVHRIARNGPAENDTSFPLKTSNIDPRDHAFILGATNPSLQPLNDLMIAAEEAGKQGAELEAIEEAWTKQAGLKLFHEAVIDVINAGVHVNKQGLVEEFLKQAKGKSNGEARSIAK